METVRSLVVNRSEIEYGKYTPDKIIYPDESEHTLWFFEKIQQFQGSLALQGANLQRWRLYKISRGKYQMLCRDRWGDILIAKLIKKKLPFDEISFVYLNQ